MMRLFLGLPVFTKMILRLTLIWLTLIFLQTYHINSFLNFKPDGGNKVDCFKSRGLHFFHFNTQITITEVVRIKILANKTRASVIAISEHGWTTQSQTQKSNLKVLMSFVMIGQETVVGFAYIKNNIAFNVRMDLCDDHIESMWAKILLPKSKPILVGVCYIAHRLTRGSSRFLRIHVSTIQSDLECFILGHFNLDYALE